jgi:bifunctional ADP-heptose synthase (sugar kinase/adenylyltransferase)
MNVLVIGDSCNDVFIRGRVDRLCPEAPVPIINPNITEKNLGMAGNVYANVRSLAPEAKVTFLCQENEITKKRYVDETSGYILLRVDENDKTTKPLTAQDLESYFIQNGIHPKFFDFVLISDYNKGFLVEPYLEGIIKYFAIHGVPVFMDTKKVLGDWSKLVSFVKINEKEFKLQCEHLPRPQDYCQNLIVTLGGKGSKWVNENVTAIGKTIEVRDVSGAGDTYFAAFAIKYLETKDVVEAMSYANKAAAVAVSKHGVVAVKKTEII